MTTPFPAFAKSNHPDVLAAARETEARHERFLEQMREFSLKYTGEPNNACFRGWFWDRMHMSGLHHQAVKDKALPGRWTQPKDIATAPYKNNPVYKEMAEIAYKAVDMPGRGNVMWGHNRMGTGTMFEHDGVVYSHVSFTVGDMSEAEAVAAEKYGWTEIMASEFHKAREDEEALRKTESEEAK